MRLKFLFFLVFSLLMVWPVIAQDNESVEVRVMSFNIWLGGELVNFDKVVEAIQLADADIVGLQEATGNTRRIADALGWSYANERTQIISRFPLIDPPDGTGHYIYAQVKPGQVVAVANVHLPSDPYGPYAVRDGADLQTVLQLEQDTRLPSIEETLAGLAGIIEAGVPLFLTGDFNTPSHLDWTEAVNDARQDVLYAVEWPVTRAVEAAGFIDTFRAVHPDPVENPGITWTYGYPYPRLNEDEIIDRIDLVFAANAVEILDSQIVGETGTPNVDIGLSPYPSDHRGVVSTVRVSPVIPPPFVSMDDRVVTIGETVVARFHAPGGEATDRIVLVAAGDHPVDDALAWLPPYEASFFGAVSFGTSALAAGEYAAVLVTEGDVELSRSPFWVMEANTLPSLSTDKNTYAAGEAITVSWQDAPAMRWDWFAIYSVDDPDLYNNYWAYAYTGATVNGSLLLDESIVGEDMLPEGDYVVRLMLDDGYEVLAEAVFTVAGN